MDFKALLAQVDTFLPRLRTLRKEVMREQQAVQDDVKTLHDRAAEISKGSSGSWIGHHASLYYKDFRKPPFEHRFDPVWGTVRGLPGPWYEVTFEGIAKTVEHDDVTGVDELLEMAAEQVKKCEQFREDLVISFSVLKSLPGFEAEAAILDKIESHGWGFSAQDFAQHQAPKSFISRDDRAMGEGVQAPPHVMYDSNILAAQSRFKAVEEFCGLSRRLLEQTRTKIQVAAVAPTSVGALGLEPGQNLIVQICKGFHRAARQLRQRHDNRPTLDLNDEYDVQDLLHAILRLHFEDIRPEEYTPSYGGGSARVDFLLKKERVAIEVKKTRPGLTEKQLSEELIIDIARYRAHPDCGTLVCFIYDPEGRIGNPRGIENDLNAPERTLSGS